MSALHYEVCRHARTQLWYAEIVDGDSDEVIARTKHHTPRYAAGEDARRMIAELREGVAQVEGFLTGGKP